MAEVGRRKRRIFSSALPPQNSEKDTVNFDHDECFSSTSVTRKKKAALDVSNKNKFFSEDCDIGVTQELGAVAIIRCCSCRKSIGHTENGRFYSMKDVLQPHNSPKLSDGWRKIQRKWERRTLFVLSQLVYKDYEEPDESLLQVDFAFPPSTDLVKLLWVNKHPVGFYSVKPKGTLDQERMQSYVMPTLDTLFIRQQHRHKGLGLAAVKNFRNHFPTEDVGFSFPISLPMAHVLKKYLELTPSDRPRFWEINTCGSEGNTRNLWLMFRQSTKAGTGHDDGKEDETLSFSFSLTYLSHKWPS